MKKHNKLIIQLLLFITSTPVFAKGMSNLDFSFHTPPDYKNCPIPGANEKNDFCLLYKFAKKNHSELISCSTDDAEKLLIVKTVYRIDNYEVLAFGGEFFGFSNTAHGFASDVSVTNYKAAYSEPYKINFYTTESVRSPVGVLPNMMTVIFLGEKESEDFKLNCNYVKH